MKKHHSKALLFTGIFFLPLFLLMEGCKPQAKAPPKNTLVPSVKLEVLEAADFEEFLFLTGTVEPLIRAILSSPAEGPVVFSDIREGDAIVAGQELFRIGRRDYADAALASANAELMRQSEDFRRTEQLVQKGAISKDQLDLARSNLEKARAAFAQSQQLSEDYSVFAPWGGIVAKVVTSVGNYVAPRTPMAEIYDPSSLVLRFAVPEDHALHVRKGLYFTAHFDAIPDDSFVLQVSQAYGDIDRRLRVRFFEADLPKGKTFIPGMFARLRIPIQTIPNALTVPEACILGGANKPFVFTVLDGVAAMRPIRTGLAQDGRVVVTEGLRTGEKVVVQGFERIKDGSQVKVATPDVNSTAELPPILP